MISLRVLLEDRTRCKCVTAVLCGLEVSLGIQARRRYTVIVMLCGWELNIITEEC